MLCFLETDWTHMEEKPAPRESSRSLTELYEAVWLACTRLKQVRSDSSAASAT